MYIDYSKIASLPSVASIQKEINSLTHAATISQLSKEAFSNQQGFAAAVKEALANQQGFAAAAKEALADQQGFAAAVKEALANQQGFAAAAKEVFANQQRAAAETFSATMNFKTIASATEAIRQLNNERFSQARTTLDLHKKFLSNPSIQKVGSSLASSPALYASLTTQDTISSIARNHVRRLGSHYSSLASEASITATINALHSAFLKDDFSATANQIARDVIPHTSDTHDDLSEDDFNKLVIQASAELQNTNDANTFINVLKTIHPIIRNYILTTLNQIIVAYFVLLTGPDVHFYYEKQIKPNILAVKEIKKTPQTSDGIYLTSKNRFVGAHNVRLRKGPSRSSEIICLLPFGKTVEVIQKKKNWTKIKIKLTDETTVDGWAATRFMYRFKF